MRPHPLGAAAAKVAPGGNAIAHRLQPPIRLNPTGPSPASPSRNRPRTARRQLWPATVLVALLTALLAACSGPTVPSGHPLQVWDRAELDAVLDLRSLGRFTIATDGTVLLGGKVLDPALVSYPGLRTPPQPTAAQPRPPRGAPLRTRQGLHPCHSRRHPGRPRSARRHPQRASSCAAGQREPRRLRHPGIAVGATNRRHHPATSPEPSGSRRGRSMSRLYVRRPLAALVVTL